MTNYVNGVPVDQLKIIPEGDGYRIEYIEKFDILKATNREIIDKLMADELKCIPVIYEIIPFVNEFQTFFGYQFLIEEIPDNSTIEINNSTTNNSTIIIPEYQNNDTEIQYNDTIVSEEEIVRDTSTLDASNILGVDRKTGISLWMIGGLIVLAALILILRDKS